jgi:competence protein ComEC
MKKIAFIAAVLLILASGCAKESYPYAKGKNLSVVFFDVGHGDSAMIITPDSRKILIDCGEFNDTAFYLKTMNITWIDVLIITHPDKDHEGGCNNVRKVAEIGKTLTNTNVEEDFLLDITKTAFAEVIVAYDSNGRFKGDNDNSVMLKMGYGNISFLFTGDCEWRCEEELLKTHDIDVDILKTGHHGSKHSSTAEFLEKASPSAAIISAGRKNRYGHPHNETLERLRMVNASVYRTDINGTIIITTDGSTYSLI